MQTTPSTGGLVIENDWPDDECRAHERHKASSHLLAFELPDGGLLGELVDISLGGFQLQAMQAPLAGAQLAVRIDVRMDGQDIARIDAQARCVWSKCDKTDATLRVGFEFLAMSDQASRDLRRLIEMLSA